MKYTQHKFEKLNVSEHCRLENCNDIRTDLAWSGAICEACVAFP
jgi:hypothetical protein